MEFNIKNGVLLWTIAEIEGDVVVPESVREIGAVVFGNNKKIKSITIPDSVTSIALYAFRGCVNLTDIRLPKNLTKISPSLFSNCESLKEITIPENVTEIRTMAFENCEKLKTIVIPKNVREISSNVFRNCRDLKTVTLPYGLKKIGVRVFEGCKKLETIKIEQLIEINVKQAPSNISNLIYMIVNRDFSKCVNRKLAEYLFSFKDKNMRAYIIDNFTEIVNHTIINYNNIEMLNELMEEKDFFTQNNIDECIQYAIDHEKHEIYIMLVNYKAERFGMSNNLEL